MDLRGPLANAGILQLPVPSTADPKRRMKPLVWNSAVGDDQIGKIKDQNAVSSHPTSTIEIQSPTPAVQPHAINKQPPNTTTQINSNHYAHSYPISGSRRKKQAYPLMPIASEFWDQEKYEKRSKYVTTELRRQLLKHRHLIDRVDLVSFRPCMVGTCPQTATPSIIVDCTAKDSKTLRALFRDARDKLYCGKQSLAFRLFKRDPPPKPPFHLVYSRGENLFIPKAAWHTVTADVSTVEFLCGTPLYYLNSQANIGMTLKVGDEVLSTTVDHLFGSSKPLHSLPKPHDNETEWTPSDSTDQCTLNDDDLVSLDPLWEDDDDDDDDVEDINHSHTVVNSHVPAEGGLGHSKNPAKIVEGLKVDGPVELPASAPFLDYGMVSLDRSILQQRQPNTFRLPGSHSSTKELQAIAKTPRSHGAPVYILSGIRGVRTGQLLRNYAYLGSQPGQDMCKVWTLILGKSDRLANGECGSIVVDSETFEVYGHIIGSNPMEHAYVVPFKTIIKQIKFTFGTSNISILRCSKVQAPKVESSAGATHTDHTLGGSAERVTRSTDKDQQTSSRKESTCFMNDCQREAHHDDVIESIPIYPKIMSPSNRESSTSYSSAFRSTQSRTGFTTPDHGVNCQRSSESRSSDCQQRSLRSLPSQQSEIGSSNLFSPPSALKRILNKDKIIPEFRCCNPSAKNTDEKLLQPIRDQYPKGKGKAIATSESSVSAKHGFSLSTEQEVNPENALIGLGDWTSDHAPKGWARAKKRPRPIRRQKHKKPTVTIHMSNVDEDSVEERISYLNSKEAQYPRQRWGKQDVNQLSLAEEGHVYEVEFQSVRPSRPLSRTRFYILISLIAAIVLTFSLFGFAAHSFGKRRMKCTEGIIFAGTLLISCFTVLAMIVARRNPQEALLAGLFEFLVGFALVIKIHDFI